MTIALRGAAVIPTGSQQNPTTTFYFAVPATVAAGDVGFIALTSRDSTALGSIAVADTQVSWTRFGNSSDYKLTLWWRRADANTHGITVTISGCVGSCAGVMKWFSGVSSDATPYADFAAEANGSGDETQAGFVPTNADSMLFAAVCNYTNDITPDTMPAFATAGATTSTICTSTGGSDCSVVLGHVAVSGGPAATGDMTWAQANATTHSAVWSLKPSGVYAVTGAESASAGVSTPSAQAAFAVAKAETADAGTAMPSAQASLGIAGAEVADAGVEESSAQAVFGVAQTEIADAADESAAEGGPVAPAKRFYFSAVVGDVAVDPAAWDYTTGAQRKRLVAIKDNSGLTNVGFWVAASVAANATAIGVQFVSDPMAAGVAFSTSNTIKLQILCAETNVSNNINRAPICVKVVSQDGATLRATLKSLAHIGPSTTEWPTTLTNRSIADGDTLDTDYETIDGDRLVVEIGGQVSDAGGTNVTGYFQFRADGSADLGEDETSTDQALNPWFEITAEIGFSTTLLEAESAIAVDAQQAVATLGVSVNESVGATDESSPGGSVSMSWAQIEIPAPEEGAQEIAVTETADASDAPSVQAAFETADVETVGASDAPSVQAAFVVIGAETTDAGDTPSAMQEASVSVAESAAAQDVSGAGETGYEIATAFDAPSAQVEFAAAGAETATVGDESSVSGPSEVAATETAAANESSAAQAASAVAETETASTIDSASAQAAFDTADTETAASSDTQAAQAVFVVAGAETAASEDAQSAQAAFSAAGAESAAASDEQSTQAAFVTTGAEIVAASDAQSAARTGAVSVAESASASDLSGAGETGYELAAASDAQSAQASLGVAKAESAAASDALSSSAVYAVMTAESAATSEVTDGGVGTRESAAASDASSVLRTTAVSVAESASAADTASGGDVVVELAAASSATSASVVRIAQAADELAVSDVSTIGTITAHDTSEISAAADVATCVVVFSGSVAESTASAEDVAAVQAVWAAFVAESSGSTDDETLMQRSSTELADVADASDGTDAWIAVTDPYFFARAAGRDFRATAAGREFRATAAGRKFIAKPDPPREFS